jgi:hypothetical protein
MFSVMRLPVAGNDDANVDEPEAICTMLNWSRQALLSGMHNVRSI